MSGSNEFVEELLSGKEATSSSLTTFTQSHYYHMHAQQGLGSPSLCEC